MNIKHACYSNKDTSEMAWPKHKKKTDVAKA